MADDDKKPRSIFGYDPEAFEVENLKDPIGQYRYRCKRCGWTYDARRHADVAPHRCVPRP